MTARYIIGDVFDALATLEDDSVDLVFTSPPFLALRSYLPADHPDKAKEIGSEATPADFLDTLLDVVEACDRVLAPHGSLCFELGDTYAGSGGGGGDYLEGGLREGQPGFGGSAERQREGNAAHWRQKNRERNAWPLDKSLCGVPTLFAWSLAYGRNLLRPERTTPSWRIRNLVVWGRPNPPVGALGDKWRPASSYVTVACKARDRWFDLDAVRVEPSANDRRQGAYEAAGGGAFHDHSNDGNGRQQGAKPQGGGVSNPAGAPPLDWQHADFPELLDLPTAPYPGSHYATMPGRLVAPFIDCMAPRRVCTECGKPSERIVQAERRNGADDTTRNKKSAHVGGYELPPERGWEYDRETLGWTDCEHDAWRRGVVLDPFAGSGTTAAVALGMGRDAVLVDLDERNYELAYERIGGLFLGEPERVARQESVL